MADLAVAAIPSELNYEPVTSIPPGYQTVQFKVPSYNNIPAPTPVGTEIQINIPHTENTFLDPTTSYLDVSCEVEADLSLNGSGYSQTGVWGLPGYGPGDYIVKACLNYLRGPGWTMFRRYQVYANGAVNIEDIDEVGILTSMMNNLSRSNVTWVSGAAMGDDEQNICPGMKFGFCYVRAVPYYGLAPNKANAATPSTLAIPWSTFSVADSAISPSDVGIAAAVITTPQFRIARTLSSLKQLSDINVARGVYPGSSMFKDNELLTYSTAMTINARVYCLNNAWEQTVVKRFPGGIYWMVPRDDGQINSLIAAGSAFAAAFDSHFVVNVRYPVRRNGVAGWSGDRIFHPATSAANGGDTRRPLSYLASLEPILIFKETTDTGDFGGGTTRGTTDVDVIRPLTMENNSKVKYAFRVSLPLFGLLGSNNDKLYPLFCGPTQLRLTTEEPTKFIRQSSELSNLSFKIRELNFCCNQLVLSSDAINAVIGRLPIENLIPIRCTTFTHSSEVIPSASQGLNQLLVASRRASMKALFIHYERAADQIAITEGKYASIHPNIGQGTHLFLNNTMYPRHGIDMSGNPSDAYQQLLITLNQTQSALMRPNIKFSEFLASDSNYGTLEDYQTVLMEHRDRGSPIQNYTSGITTGGGSADLPTSKWQSDIARGIAVHPLSDLPYVQKQIEIPRNKAWTAIDTEHFGRRNFLSGVSTLTGNTFYNLQIKSPLTSGYVVHFFNYHDIILAFDLKTRNVTIKI